MRGMKPAVFLDLDNTIIEDVGGPVQPGDVVLIKGAAPAIASLRGLGYRVVVVANHEAVARGGQSEGEVEALHARVAELIRNTANGALVDAFYYCPYHPKGVVDQYKRDHPNRKPKPGMLTQAAEELELDLASSWMIGDELADVQAGHAAGARTVLLRPDADRLNPVDPDSIEGVTNEAPDLDRPAGPDFYAVGLVDAARLIAQQPRVEQQEQKGHAPGRRWDAQKIAKIQIPRPPQDGEPKPIPQAKPGRAFRPWGAPTHGDKKDKPVVAKPYRKRHQATETAEPIDQVDTAIAVPPAAAHVQSTRQAIEPANPAVIPENIRTAIERKKRAAEQGEPLPEGQEKLLRMILQELRSQRGSAQEFSFLAIVAVALQLIAIVCLLGGLFMGGESDGLFLRWLGAGLVSQLTAIATLLYGR